MRHRFFHIASVSICCAALSGAASAQEPDPVLVDLVGIDGSDMGSIAARPAAGGGVLFDLNVTGLASGSLHGFHIHETGECDASGGFQSAGGHFAPDGNDHGFFVETGFHAGDMPNIQATELGDVRASVFNHAVTLAEDAPNGILGRAIVIHANFDDYTSQPSGAAGDRIACGVIGG